MTSRRPLTATPVETGNRTGEILGHPGERKRERAATADENVVVAGAQASRVR